VMQVLDMIISANMMARIFETDVTCLIRWIIAFSRLIIYFEGCLSNQG
jgi:hypothetical protein